MQGRSFEGGEVVGEVEGAKISQAEVALPQPVICVVVRLESRKCEAQFKEENLPIATFYMSTIAIWSLALLSGKAVLIADTCIPDFEYEVAASRRSAK